MSSINKFFRFKEGLHTIEFRMEFFNMPNTPNFGHPGMSLRTPILNSPAERRGPVASDL